MKEQVMLLDMCVGCGDRAGNAFVDNEPYCNEPSRHGFTCYEVAMYHRNTPRPWEEEE